tara:strand:+ start:87 stop:302 length:216 start_codon:yes stop_codon:yes gene_type:complete
MQRTATVIINASTNVPTRIFINEELFIDDILSASAKYTFMYNSTKNTDKIKLSNLKTTQTHDLPTTNHINI